MILLTHTGSCEVLQGGAAETTSSYDSDIRLL